MAKDTVKSTDFFSQTFLDEMRELLETQLEETMNELKKLTHPVGDDPNDTEAIFPDYGNEEDDDVKEVEAFMVNKPMEIVLEKKLRDIEKAIKRLDNGTYGICKYTGEAIDERRLRARPTSSSSVAAKKLLTDEA